MTMIAIANFDGYLLRLICSNPLINGVFASTLYIVWALVNMIFLCGPIVKLRNQLNQRNQNWFVHKKFEKVLMRFVGQTKLGFSCSSFFVVTYESYFNVLLQIIAFYFLFLSSLIEF